MAQSRAEFANFLCHFGKSHFFLDYLEQVMLPAFTDDTMVRSIGVESRKHYHFHDVKVEILGGAGDNTILGVSGHFVKEVNLVRTQVFDKKLGLVEDKQSLDSSPSSFFILVLNNHQLIFYPETTHAPSISEFQSTIRRFSSDKHEAFINQQYEALNASRSVGQGGSRVTKKKLREEHPSPGIDIVPFANSQSIREFVLQFSKLSNMDFRLLRPNPTFDAEEAFSQVRGVLSELGADRAKLSTGNIEDGLNKEKAIEIIQKAALGGNQEVSLKGKTYNGSTIIGTNDDFKATVPISNVDGTRRGLVSSLYSALIATVATASMTAVEADRHRSILSRLADYIRRTQD